MKIRNILLGMAAAFMLASCSTKTETEPVCRSAKAEQVRSTAALFDAMAIQPEISDELVRSTCEIAGYDDFSELLPLGGADEERMVGEARGEALAAFFSGIARNPDFAGTLDAAAESLLGTADGLSGMTVLLDYSGYASLSGYLDALARNPEAVAQLESYRDKYLGIPAE